LFKVEQLQPVTVEKNASKRMDKQETKENIPATVDFSGKRKQSLSTTSNPDDVVVRVSGQKSK